MKQILSFLRDEILQSVAKGSLPQDNNTFHRFLIRSAQHQFGAGLPVRNDNSATVCKKLWMKVKKYVPFLQIVPFVRMVAVVNSLAMGTAKETSDIDLFIVCHKGRLFLARTFVTALLHLLGVRRHGKKVAGRFCLSFFVSENALDLKNLRIQPSDPYLAQWVATVTPLFGKNTYEDFLKKNEPWVREYVSTPTAPQTLYLRDSFFLTKMQFVFEKMLEIFGAGWMEKRLMAWQIPRAKKKAAALHVDEPAVVVTKDILKFHDNDRRENFKTVILSD